MVQVRAEHPVNQDGTVDIPAWIERIQGLVPLPEPQRLLQACEWASELDNATIHTEHRWANGASSYRTGLEMAEILADLKMDQDSLVAAVIYRAVRELKTDLQEVERRLGADVTVLEAMPDFLATVDQQAAKEAQKAFAKQGLVIHTGVKTGEITTDKNGVTVPYTDSSGAEQTLSVDKLIVSIGRVPNVDGLGVETVGLKTDERGFIVVDEDCKTNLPNVWAVGDVVRGPMLAHKAEAEGVAVAETISGQHGSVNYDLIPSVIYTSPEVAWVGKNEQQLKAEGRDYQSGSFPFMANGRARALGDTTGFVKILADTATDEVLGVHIVGPSASELIAEAVAIMEFRGASEDIARICHAHPTLSEAMKEAALAVSKRTLNF